MVNGFRLAGMLAVLALGVVPVQAAKRLGPPSRFLTAPENRAAVVRAVEVGEEDVLFERLAELHGESPERFRVRLGEEARERVAAGESYVLGYTVLRRDRRGAPVWELDPGGPRIVEVPAVGAAIFDDSEAVRSLIAGVEETEPRILLDAIVRQLERPDPASRRLVLAELMLRPELAEAVEESDLEVFRHLLESGELEPVATDYLLRGLRPSIDSEVGWLRPICLEIVASHDRDLDLASMIPALLETALDLLGELGRPEDAERLAEHLYSNNPGVGRQAAQAMAELDPAVARREFAAALETGGAHPDVARVLHRWNEQAEP